MPRLDFNERREARIARLEDRAERLHKEGAARVDRAGAMAAVIPFGQPILVGHHSEKRDRNYRGRIDAGFRKGFEQIEAARDVARRAEAAAENTAVFADDPEAVTKLKEQLAELEAAQVRDKAINGWVRKARKNRAAAEAGLAAMGLPPAAVAAVFTPDCMGCIGVPDYRLKNRGANIRRIEQRIQHLARAAADVTKEEQIGDVRLVDNVEDNRMQLFFPGKPPEAIRERLKGAGFRWAPTDGAWQRHRSNAALYHAREIAKTFAEPAVAAEAVQA